jgi:hypothetical protein
MRIRIQAGITTSLMLLVLLVSSTAGTQASKSGTISGIGAGCTGDCDLPTLWRSVDAVVFLRIQKTLGTRTQTLDGRECLWIEHRASVHEVFRRFRGKPQSSVDLLQLRDATAPTDPGYMPDQEFVAFLRWNDEEQMFEPYIMIPVREGQVKSPRIQVLESGMKFEAFLKILRAMME